MMVTKSRAKRSRRRRAAASRNPLKERQPAGTTARAPHTSVPWPPEPRKPVLPQTVPVQGVQPHIVSAPAPVTGAQPDVAGPSLGDSLSTPKTALLRPRVLARSPESMGPARPWWTRAWFSDLCVLAAVVAFVVLGMIIGLAKLHAALKAH